MKDTRYITVVQAGGEPTYLLARLDASGALAYAVGQFTNEDTCKQAARVLSEAAKGFDPQPQKEPAE